MFKTLTFLLSVQYLIESSGFGTKTQGVAQLLSLGSIISLSNMCCTSGLNFSSLIGFHASISYMSTLVLLGTSGNTDLYLKSN